MEYFLSSHWTRLSTENGENWQEHNYRETPKNKQKKKTSIGRGWRSQGFNEQGLKCVFLSNFTISLRPSTLATAESHRLIKVKRSPWIWVIKRFNFLHAKLLDGVNGVLHYPATHPYSFSFPAWAHRNTDIHFLGASQRSLGRNTVIQSHSEAHGPWVSLRIVQCF